MRFTERLPDFAEAIRSKYVADVFEANRVKAEAWARRAEAALSRKRWKLARKHASWALHLCPDSVSGLVAAGRRELLMRRIGPAKEYFNKALVISPRAPVHKELGWIDLEEGRFPDAISKLSEYVKVCAADLEAFNLLLKCFYLTNRYDAGDSLANAMQMAKAPSNCFHNNGFLCCLLNGGYSDDALRRASSREFVNPFLRYNVVVATETIKAWDKARPLKSKLLFEEYRFGIAPRKVVRNALSITDSDGGRSEFDKPIVTVGSLSANDVVLADASVSRRHLVILNYPDDVWIHDLESTQGTRVDDESLKGRRFLDGVHSVELGRVKIRVAAERALLI